MLLLNALENDPGFTNNEFVVISNYVRTTVDFIVYVGRVRWLVIDEDILAILVGYLCMVSRDFIVKQHNVNIFATTNTRSVFK